MLTVQHETNELNALFWRSEQKEVQAFPNLCENLLILEKVLWAVSLK